MDIWIALYKGQGTFINKIVRKWTNSSYSHAELILDDKQTWIGISPFLKAKVVKRTIETYDPEKWDFFKIPVTEEQHKTILYYFNDSDGDTVFYKNKKIIKRITPVLNSGICFDGSIYHSSSKPIKNIKRLVMNINICN